MITRKDHGYSWVVLAASFLSHAANIGFSYGTLGSAAIAHQSHFKIDLNASSWLGSVQVFVVLAAAPLASVAVEKLGCRVTEIAGGVCVLLGVGLSYFSTQLWHAYLLYSILPALGFSATYMASSAILAQYFDRHKYLAFAIVVLGFYLGMSFWPVLSQALFSSLGYNKAMAVMSSFMPIHIICGILYYSNETSEDVEVTKGELDETSEGGEKKLDNSTDLSMSEIKSDEGVIRRIALILSQWKIWALLINCLLWQLSMASFLTLVNDYMVNFAGIDESQAALGVTILGVGNLVGCILMMLTSQLTFDRLILHTIISSVWGAAIIFSPFSNGVILFYCMAVVYGVAQGIQIANLLSVIYDFCGAEQLALLFGVELLAEGIGALVGAPLCGYMQSTIGSKAGLFASGSTAILASFCLLPVIIHNVRSRRQAETDTIKAIVIGIEENRIQKDVVQGVTDAAAPNYPHLHKPHMAHHHDNQGYDDMGEEIIKAL